MLDELIRRRTRRKAMKMLFPKQFEEEEKKKELERIIRDQPHVKELMELTPADIRPSQR